MTNITLMASLPLLDYCKYNMYHTDLLSNSYSLSNENSFHSHSNTCTYEPGHEKTCLMSYANNKGADQPALSRSLISTFVVRCLDSVMSLVPVTKISSLMLASVAVQSSLTWSETPEDTFSHDEAHIFTVSDLLVQSSNRSPRMMSNFRKHKITKDLKRATVEQLIIYLSKLQKFIFRKKYVHFFGRKKESILPKYAPTIWLSRALDIQNHTFFHWFWTEKAVDLSVSKFFLCCDLSMRLISSFHQCKFHFGLNVWYTNNMKIDKEGSLDVWITWKR